MMLHVRFSGLIIYCAIIDLDSVSHIQILPCFLYISDHVNTTFTSIESWYRSLLLAVNIVSLFIY